MKQQKIAFYNPPFPRIKSFYEMIDLAVEYGLPAVEGFCHMELTEPDVEAAKKIRAYADEKGIVFCCFSVYADLVGEDSEAQIERMKGFTDVAAILGSPFIHHTVIITNDHARLTPENKEKLFYKGIDGIRQVYDYAATLGVRAVYEDQAFVYNGLEGFSRLLAEVDRDIGVVADLGNICQMEEEIQPIIRRFPDKIVHVHIKDMKWSKTKAPDSDCTWPTWQGNWVKEVEIGQGDVNFDECFALLKEIGYDGYYGLEYFAKSDDSPAIDEALEKLHNWLA
ncbi:MAG: sugar phosphate isomerase/epimerase [Clostridia bacterium]|nr:sugar phosphate isomerase/epimerase [Clostridia bacterium]